MKQEGKGRERKGREGKGREGKGRERNAGISFILLGSIITAKEDSFYVSQRWKFSMLRGKQRVAKVSFICGCLASVEEKNIL